MANLMLVLLGLGSLFLIFQDRKNPDTSLLGSVRKQFTKEENKN